MTATATAPVAVRASRYDLRVVSVLAVAVTLVVLFVWPLALAWPVAVVSAAAVLLLWALDVVQGRRQSRARWLAWLVIGATMIVMVAVVYEVTLARL